MLTVTTLFQARAFRVVSRTDTIVVHSALVVKIAAGVQFGGTYSLRVAITHWALSVVAVVAGGEISLCRGTCCLQRDAGVSDASIVAWWVVVVP